MGTLAASTPALFPLLKAADLAVAASLSSWVQLRPCTGKEEGATVVASHAPGSTVTQESKECFSWEFGVHTHYAEYNQEGDRRRLTAEGRKPTPPYP